MQAPPSYAAPDLARRVSVLVITVSYKTAALVEKSLAALAHERATCPDLDISVYVVDNASGDEPQLRQAIEREGWQSWVTLELAPKNGGFSYGNNLGLKHAYSSVAPPDYVLLLNPDASVKPGAIGALARFLDSRPAVAVAGSKLLFEDGTPWPYAFRFPTIWSEINEGLNWGPATKLLSPWVVARKMNDYPERVDWLPGAAMMIKRSVIDELGGMDESYFLYFEELDFFLKLHRAGWQAWYVPSSEVIHVAGASSGVTTRGRNAPLPDYWFESRRRFFAKNFGIPYAMATDAAALAAQAVCRFKRALTGESEHNIPGYLSSFLNSSVLRTKNHHVESAVEFQPSQLHQR
jgi:N-acetylglucosaminyl-diphospho-decaprenol L-rhamnosyltransferase